VFGRLGLLGKAKRFNPDLIVGLMGCMVEEHREKLFKRFPQLDLMVGTRNIKDLPRLVQEVRQTRRQTAMIKQDGISIEYTEQILRKGNFHAWLPIMTGCNKVCTFCIVPITRGAEVSMPARDVYREASRLVDDGVKCITLLGQNVNSYKRGSKVEGRGSKQAFPSTLHPPPSTDFPELLEMLCEIDGLERISFTTSHPHDATEELFRVIARNPKISRRFHLPLQSGSDRMLKRMKRLHTFAEYKEKIDLMREIIPDVCVTTDIISGFSGETEEDHRLTARALEEIRYDDAYIYKYSVRPGTPAAKLPDDVPLPIKEERNAELLTLQRRVASGVNEKWQGRTVEVFVEQVNERDESQLMCRTIHDKSVVVPGPKEWIGSFKTVTIQELRNGTFLAALIS
jgi:tRNA-2-methylthio-N6-dimethylallyladenosine synthase